MRAKNKLEILTGVSKVRLHKKNENKPQLDENKVCVQIKWRDLSVVSKYALLKIGIKMTTTIKEVMLKKAELMKMALL